MTSKNTSAIALSITETDPNAEARHLHSFLSPGKNADRFEQIMDACAEMVENIPEYYERGAYVLGNQRRRARGIYNGLRMNCTNAQRRGRKELLDPSKAMIRFDCEARVEDIHEDVHTFTVRVEISRLARYSNKAVERAVSAAVEDYIEELNEDRDEPDPRFASFWHLRDFKPLVDIKTL